MDKYDIESDIVEPLNPNVFGGKHFIMMVIGQPRSGKTSFLKDIYARYLSKKFVEVHIFAPKATLNDYKFMEPNAVLHPDVVDEKNKPVNLIEQFYDEQQEKTEEDENQPRKLVIIDDHYEKDVSKNLGITKLFTSGAHINCSVVYICHYYYVIASEVMKNCTTIFAFFRNNMKARNAMANVLADNIFFTYPEEDEKFLRELAKRMINERVISTKFCGLIVAESGIYEYKPKHKKQQ